MLLVVSLLTVRTFGFRRSSKTFYIDRKVSALLEALYWRGLRLFSLLCSR